MTLPLMDSTHFKMAVSDASPDTSLNFISTFTTRTIKQMNGNYRLEMAMLSCPVLNSARLQRLAARASGVQPTAVTSNEVPDRFSEVSVSTMRLSNHMWDTVIRF